MKAKKVMRDEHGPRHVTPAGRSVFYDLFPKAEADELVMRSTLLMGLEHWLKESGLTQTQAAKALGITQARVTDIRPKCCSHSVGARCSAIMQRLGALRSAAAPRPRRNDWHSMRAKAYSRTALTVEG